MKPTAFLTAFVTTFAAGVWILVGFPGRWITFESWNPLEDDQLELL